MAHLKKAANRRRALILCLVAGFLSSAVVAAQPTIPQGGTPPANPEQIRYPQPAGRSYLQERFGLDRADADRRQRLERSVSDFASSLQEAYPDAYLATIIDHQPNYSVTVVFSREVTANELQARIPAELRPFVRTKRSRFTAEQIEERKRSVAAALGALQIAHAIGYDYRTDRFRITTDDEPTNILTRLPPQLRSDVDVVRGGTPGLFQTGVRPGDALYGGWIMQTGTEPSCTFGFPFELRILGMAC